MKSSKRTGTNLTGLALLPLAIMLAYSSAYAEPFETDAWKGAWDTQFTLATGIRTGDPSGNLTQIGNKNEWGGGDYGDLNYKKGQLFSGQFKITSELLATNKATGIDMMARGTGFYDALAEKTKYTEMSQGAKNQMVSNFQLLDLWAGHKFTVGDNQWRFRIGNQVINWGESTFLFGGINATAAIDYQKSLIPGTQIKEYILPAPMMTVAGQLGNGWNGEAYYQFRQVTNRYPAIGSYWSTANYFGKGTKDALSFDPTNFNGFGQSAAQYAQQYLGAGSRVSASQLELANQQLLAGMNGTVADLALPDKKASNAGQFGFALHHFPEGSGVDLGLYYLHYTDKSPVFQYLNDPTVSGGGDIQAKYLTNRQLFGVSTNFQLGNWAIGSELSYRPKDAVALVGCFTNPGPLDANTNPNPLFSAVPGSLQCPLYKDMKKWEWHVTAQSTLTPSDNPLIMADILKAQSATLTAEAVATYYPGVKSTMSQNVGGTTVYQGVASAGLTFLDNTGIVQPIGTAMSTGAIVDFNWTYDGTIAAGWQFTPGITYYHAISGDTPNPAGTYLAGAQSVNLYFLMNQNPTTWQAGINFTAFSGGKVVGAQPYKDRNLIGAFITYNY
ncbi:hypothetical protein AAKU67_002850 [Oxalobacteraceae bacterium GrIS 2.11]